MSLRELIVCALVKCVPMTESEYQALLRRQKHNVGKRRVQYLHPNLNGNHRKFYGR